MSHPTCACGRTFTDGDRMGASAFACPQCGAIWRPPAEPQPPAPPSPLPEPKRSRALRGALGCLLGVAVLAGIPYGMWTCAKAMDSRRGGSGPVVPSGPVLPKEVVGPLLKVTSGGLEGTRFPIGAPGERLVAYVEIVSGPEVTIHVMTAADYESAKARWGKEFITEYKRLQGFSMSGRGKIRLHASDGLMPPGSYVLALLGGDGESTVRVQVKTER